MIRPSHLLLICTAALTLLISAPSLRAQDSQSGTNQRPRGNGGAGRQRNGNFDPAQFQQRMMDRYKERLEITDDTEWKAIQPLIQKVLDTRMAMGGGRGGFGRGGRGNDANQSDQNQTQARRPANPAADQLQKAIDDKASAAEIKEALAKYQAYRKDKQAELDKAQAALRKVLSSRQEAIASLSGLL